MITVQGQATRLRVYAALRERMDADGECPTAVAIARRLDMSVEAVRQHMVALDGAAGLEFSTRGRLAESIYQGKRDARFARRYEDAPVEVDLILRGDAG